MVTTESKKTVQFVPDKLFLNLSRFEVGEQYRSIVNGFPYLTLIQPIDIEGQLLAIGLHRDYHVSHFFLFKTPDAYKKTTTKNLRIFTVVAGKVSGIHGSNARYYRNCINYDNTGKIDSHQNFLHASSVVSAELDAICQTYGVREFPADFLISTVPQSIPIAEEGPIHFNE